MEIEKIFEEEFDLGDYLTLFTIEKMLKDSLDKGKNTIIEPRITPSGLILEGPGFTAAFEEDESSDNMIEFIHAVKSGKRVYIEPIFGEFSIDRSALRLKFIIYKEYDNNEPQIANTYNPFIDKCIIPTRRMTCKEEQQTFLFIEKIFEEARSLKEKGRDVIFKIKKDGYQCFLYKSDINFKTNLEITNEKVVEYVFANFEVYARIREIDSKMKDFGFYTIKYDIIVL